MNNIHLFTDILGDEIANSQESQPLSFSSEKSQLDDHAYNKLESFVPLDNETKKISRPAKGTGQYGQFRSIDEIDDKYRSVFSYPFFNIVQSSVIEDALYSDKSMVVCAPTGSGKTVVFEMAIVQLLMELEDKQYTDDFKIIYMAPVKALCTERLTEWYPKFTKLGLLCIEVTGDTDVDFSQLKPYRIIITTPEKWDMVTRRWREHSQMVEVIKLFLIDEVHILNDETRGPVLEAVVSRMKTIESSAQSSHRIEQLQKQYLGTETTCKESPPRIRFVAVSATVSNPGDVAAWLGSADKPAVYYKFGDESRPVKLKRVVEGYPCPDGTSIFKFDIILNYKLWPIIQKYHNGKPTLIFCNTRKSVALTADTLSKELTVSFSPEQKAKLTALASTIKNKKLQMLVLSGVGCHHAGLLYEERNNIENAFRNRDLPILITTTTLAMGVNLPAHLVIVKNTQQYVNGAYQEYSISTILQMVGRAGRPQFDTEATAVIMTRLCDKPRYQALVGGNEPLQSYLHKRLPENLNSEAALGTVNDVAQCVQWVRSTFLSVRAARDPKRYLGLPQAAPQQLISKKIEELCVKAMNGLASSGLITMDEASCIESTEAGRLMSIFYLDLETMKHIMKIDGTETLERLLWIICESHELADMHLRVDERRCLNTLNRNNAAATIRFPMKGKISTRQMKLNCIIQAILGCLNIPDPSLNQEAMKIMRIADRVCKCLVAYVTRYALISQQPKYYRAILNALILAKCVAAHLWENSPYVSKQLRGIGPTFSTLLATAGKINFMLLEESHPRDLERIMNKGPPAGNILRKQVSLLPKYQLTMTPIDEKSVTIQLALINQNHLAENMEQLTAGDTHKSYMVVGDSDNNLLLLTFFKDKNLLGVYDGVITHQITRKHSFEHKIFVHCISSNFVGIDAQCEYLFKDLEAVYPSHQTVNEVSMRKADMKQTNITDTFKERKRKNASENDITQSKEKKKRDNALLQKFKSLKESLGKTSRDLKQDLDKSNTMSNKIMQEFTQLENPMMSTEMTSEHSNKRARMEPSMKNANNLTIVDNITDCAEQRYSDEKSELDDEKIDSILIEIENEISKCNNEIDLPRVDLCVNKNTQSVQSSCTSEPLSTNMPARNSVLCSKDNKAQKSIKTMKKQPQKINRSNYNFIDLLNKNMALSDEEDELVDNKDSGFSDTIKSHIDKYLQHTKNITRPAENSMIDLLLDSEGYEKKRVNTNENSKMGSQVRESNVNTSASEGNDKPNALQRKNNFGFIDAQEKNLEKRQTINEVLQTKSNFGFEEAREENIEESKTINEAAETKKHLLQTQNLDTNRTEKEVVDNCCILEATNLYFDLKTKITENPSETQNCSSLKDARRDNDKNHGNSKIPFEYDDPIAASEKSQVRNTSTQLISHSDNCYEENKETPNTIEFSSILLDFPYTTPYHSEKLKTQRHIIFQNDTKPMNKTGINLQRNQPDIDDSIRGITIASKNSDNYNNGPPPKPYNQDANIRKYSYSATKVDVATRENHVTVIRKIKMDVDITEIISQKDKKYNRQQDIENIKKGENYTMQKPETKCINFQVLESHFEGEENKTALIAYNRQKEDARQKHNIESPEINCIDFEMHEPHVEYEKNKTAVIDFNNKENVNNDLIKKDIQSIFTEQKYNEILLAPKLITLPSQLNLQSKLTAQMACNFNIKDDNVAVTLSNKNESPQKETDRLGSILQKYKKILRKDNTGNLIQTPTQSKVIDNSKQTITALPEKPKRPFKITDIHNLKTPLSKLQLSERENLDESTDMTPKKGNKPEIQNYKEQKREFTYTQVELPNENIPSPPEPKKTRRNFSQNTALNIAHNDEQVDNIEELLKFKLQDADIEDLEPCTETDFNIDQSMFNPKTLLQCFNKDELEIVIPPPPAFCDETELMPHDEIVTVPMDCYEPISWDNFCGNTPEEDVFQDDSNMDLTPRKDIETWTLSQNDDENYQHYETPAGFNSRRSSTIMHAPNQRNSQFQGVSAARQFLGQFKISPKKKLDYKQ